MHTPKCTSKVRHRVAVLQSLILSTAVYRQDTVFTSPSLEIAEIAGAAQAVSCSVSDQKAFKYSCTGVYSVP